MDATIATGAAAIMAIRILLVSINLYERMVTLYIDYRIAGN